MLDQHWRESSEDCDEASDMNLHEESGLVGIEEFRVDYPMIYFTACVASADGSR